MSDKEIINGNDSKNNVELIVEKLYSYQNINNLTGNLHELYKSDDLPDQWMLKQGTFGIPFYCFHKNYITVCTKGIKTNQFGFIKIPRNPIVFKPTYFSYKNNQMFCNYFPINSFPKRLDELINIEVGQECGEALCLNISLLTDDIANSLEKINCEPSLRKYIYIESNGNALIQYSVARNYLTFTNVIPPMCIWSNKSIFLVASCNCEINNIEQINNIEPTNNINNSSNLNGNFTIEKNNNKIKYFMIKIPRVPIETQNNCVDFIFVE